LDCSYHSQYHERQRKSEIGKEGKRKRGRNREKEIKGENEHVFERVTRTKEDFFYS
jgi:hypothetical protein